MQLPDGSTKIIPYTNVEYDQIPWLGKPALFLECSGKQTRKEGWNETLTGDTKHVIVSATSWTADQILVYGFNHEEFARDKHGAISYGSCTVNAYVPLAQLLHEQYGVLDSDVNVIHNVPVRQLESFDTIERRECTLELVAPHLLDFLDASNFLVNYSLVPYAGVSLIDYRFRLKAGDSEESIKAFIRDAIKAGSLRRLYGLVATDNGPEEHKFTSHSAVLVEPSIRRVGENLYLSAYFDNENSVNRYFDLTNYLTRRTTA